MRRFRLLCVFSLLVLVGMSAQAQDHVLVKADQYLTLRESPATNSKVIDRLVQFAPLKVLERKDKKWAKVETTDKKVGWVLAQYLSRTCFVRVDNDWMNVRRGPGTEYAVIMHYGRNYPLRVLDVANNGWLKVMDVDGDRGWVHYKMVQYDPPYVITRMKLCNVRKGPSTDNPIAFTTEAGTLLRVLEEKDGWLKVRYEDGDEGWISAKIVFGWLYVEEPKDK